MRPTTVLRAMLATGNPFKVDTRGVIAYFGFSPQTGDEDEGQRRDGLAKSFTVHRQRVGGVRGWISTGDSAGIVGTLFLAGGLIGLLFNSRPAMTWKA